VLTGPATSANGATPTFRLVNPYTGAMAQGVALVDSGDQRALCSPTLLAQIGAQQVSTEQVVGVDGQLDTAGVYLVDWYVPGAGYVSAAQPGRAPIYTLGYAGVTSLGVDALLGRNLLATGEFHYMGSQGTYSLAIGEPVPQSALSAAPLRVWLPFVGLLGLAGVAAGAFAR
jgi:hypothetical protein